MQTEGEGELFHRSSKNYFDPVLLALILFIWLVVGGALINRGIFGLLG